MWDLCTFRKDFLNLLQKYCIFFCPPNFGKIFPTKNALFHTPIARGCACALQLASETCAQCPHTKTRTHRLRARIVVYAKNFCLFAFSFLANRYKFCSGCLHTVAIFLQTECQMSVISHDDDRFAIGIRLIQSFCMFCCTLTPIR